MALKATIYKAELIVADTDRHYYATHNLTIARHPSETDLRMMVRLLAFAANADESLVFTKGISDADEPDIWIKDLTGGIDRWIEVGQPDERRLLKACGRAHEVIVYCYGGHASELWWNGIKTKLERAPRLTVINLAQATVNEMAGLAERSMRLSYNIADSTIFLSSEKGDITVQPEIWR